MSGPVILFLFIAALFDHSYTMAFVLFVVGVFRALTS